LLATLWYIDLGNQTLPMVLQCGRYGTISLIIYKGRRTCNYNR